MKCIKCGIDMPETGTYCPACGTVNERQITTPPAKPRTRPIVYATAVLAAIGLVALIVAVVVAQKGNVTSVPQGTPAPPENVLAVPPGKPADGGLMAVPPGTEGKGDVTPSGAQKPKPTPAMVDYLGYVKKVEEHRQMLLQDTTNALTLSAAGSSTQSLLSLIDMAGDPDGAEARDPLKDTKDELARQYKNWLAALEFFDKKPAPAECREFSAAYRDVLYKETKAIGDIAVSFNSVNIMNPQDMSKLLSELQKMKRDPSIQRNIDKAADTADDNLDKLVATYDMVKPFEVPREQQTSGNIMEF